MIEIEKIGKSSGPLSISLSGIGNNIIQIREFSNIFPSLENIIENSELTVQENIGNYNYNLAKIYKKVPKLISTIWEIYRRNQIHNPLFLIDLNYIESFKKNTKKEEEFLGIKNLNIKKLDEYLSKKYIIRIEQIKDVFELEKFNYINEPSNLELTDISKEKFIEYITKRDKTPIERIQNNDINLISRTFSKSKLKNRKIISQKEITFPIDIYKFRNKITDEQIISQYDLSSKKILYLNN